jgi:hypothetical protein
MVAINKSKYYLLKLAKCEFPILATGYKAQHERPYVVDDFNPAFMATNVKFRLRDGHLREYCPIVNVRQALDWLDEHKFDYVEVIEK